MKKGLPIIVIVAVLAVGGWLFLKSRQPAGPVEISPKAPATQEKSFTGKLKDMVMRGVAMKCTWKQNNSSGEGFIKDKKYYGEIESGGKKTYVIMKDNCMWSWNKSESQGVKFCFEPTETGTDFWDVENAPQGNYTCVPAVVSDAKFNPPSSVNFMDMDEMMQGLGE